MKRLFRQLENESNERYKYRIIYICVVFRATGLEEKICIEKRKRFRSEH